MVKLRLADLRRLIRRDAGGSARPLLALLPSFFKNAPEPFVIGYRPEDLMAILSRAYRVLCESRGKSVAVSVFNPDETRDGFSSDRTIVQISAPDGPFYVSSVRERLRAMGHAVIHLVHPILTVAWDTRGRLTALGGAALPRRQSLIHIEIERVDDDNGIVRIERAIRSVFTDIRMCVQDFEKMRLTLADLRRELDSAQGKNSVSEIRELSQFLQWLDDGNFVFLGYRQYDVTAPGRRGRKYFSVRRSSGLGILRRERTSRYYRPVPFSRLPPAYRRGLLGAAPYVITLTDLPAPIYRRERMTYVGVKTFDGRGRLSGERRWIGLFTNRVEGLPPAEIPILREKFQQLLAAEGVVKHSHDYREMYGIFSGYPKEFLFSARVEDLRMEIRTAMEAQTDRDFKATFRPSSLGNEISVMVVMSKDKFSRDVRLRIEEKLRQKLAARTIDYSLSMGAESAEFARLYFSCITSRKTPVKGSFAELEREMAELAKTWPDRFSEELVARMGPRQGRRIFNLYGGSFSAEFHSHTPASGAVHDIARLESLFASMAGHIQLDLFDSKMDMDCSRLKIYNLNDKLPLSDVMPVLTDHGLRVVDEVSNSVKVPGRPVAFVHTFRVQGRTATAIDVDRLGAPLCESIQAALLKQIDCDPLCSVILLADLRPREVALLRLYRNYLHQIVPVHTLGSIDRALVHSPRSARLLTDLFKARFDPSLGAANSGKRRQAVQAVQESFRDFLDDVEDIVEDRILRILANAIEATVRTNYYQNPVRPTIGIKIMSSAVHAIPPPAPLYEIFMGDIHFEGVHLRAGRIARGGIRHSDRRDDFRTEILGLMKTQRVKNAIIVPGGAKGGFVVKPTAANVVSCYRSFIRTLLDLTDNKIGPRIVHPVSCVIHDGPDPYLVVAADKGTARFSDIANEISLESGYWLGDAFASGGTNGYDHKKLGITARGTWECVRHHLSVLLSEQRIANSEQRPYLLTCAGIGDMSGDVFGNGMLIGEGLRVGRRRISLRLRAAFNHQYIFLDPDPDPRISHAERKRLFRTPGLSWKDYDPRAISTGGGVFLRTAKSIALPRPAAAMLGLSPGTASGEEVVRAILKLKVDLLYNGGIGTYVKATAERHADVEDPVNDRVRINASELRCRIVAEGGNGGLTQAARVEYARVGGRINTDAVDNSAGVDLSDHEVNLKIFLQSLRIPVSRRRSILRRMEAPVSRVVLQDNALQSRVLSLEESRSSREIRFYPRLMDILDQLAGLSRDIEGLPSDKALAEIAGRVSASGAPSAGVSDAGREKRSAGLARPELAVLMAYVKLALERVLMERVARTPNALTSDAIFGRFLRSYFPAEVSRRFGGKLANHSLAEQIAATVAANTFVNRAGLTMAFRLSEECGSGPADVIRSYFVAELLVNAETLRVRIQSADPKPALRAWDFLEEGLAGICRWLLKEYAGKDMAGALQRFKSTPEMLAQTESLLSETEKKNFLDSAAAVRSWGIEASLACRLAEVKWALHLMELQVAGARLKPR